MSDDTLNMVIYLQAARTNTPEQDAAVDAERDRLTVPWRERWEASTGHAEYGEASH